MILNQPVFINGYMWIAYFSIIVYICCYTQIHTYTHTLTLKQSYKKYYSTFKEKLTFFL